MYSDSKFLYFIFYILSLEKIRKTLSILLRRYAVLTLEAGICGELDQKPIK